MSRAEMAKPESEDEDYPYLEGAFFGNLFLSTPKKFSCKGSHANVNIGRSCTKDAAGCGYTSAGYCADVCDTLIMRSGAKRWGHCIGTGQTWNHPMTVALSSEDTNL